MKKVPTTINIYALAFVVASVLFATPVFAGCTVGPVTLEVAIGTVTSVTSLGAYVAILYKFIIGMTAIAAVAIIAFNGFGWAIAAGNAEKVGDAKKKIINALFGLVLALLSYTVLYMINSEMVSFQDICPPDLMFSTEGSFSTAGWDECPGGQTSECSVFDYCVGSCTCGVVYSGDTKTYCIPTGNETNGEGLACYRDTNCVPPMTCIGSDGTIKTVGFCTAEVPGEFCETTEDCAANFQCEGPTAATMKCLTVNQRENLQYCTADTQCASGICNTADGQKVCMQGDGTTGVTCSGDNDNCARGYKCESGGSGGCVPRVEGDDCNASDRICYTGYYCDYSGLNRCYDGSEGDPCDTMENCQLAGNYCDFTGSNACYDGSLGDPCDENAQCDSGNCGGWGADECL